MIKIYRQTATIKAEQFDGSDFQAKRLGLTDLGEDWGLEIETNEFVALNSQCWIVTDIYGNRYCIADDVFRKKYAELPVIPKVWADTIEEYKANHYRLGEIFTEWNLNYDEQELIARAWLDGYQVKAQHDTRTD